MARLDSVLDVGVARVYSLHRLRGAQEIAAAFRRWPGLELPFFFFFFFFFFLFLSFTSVYEELRPSEEMAAAIRRWPGLGFRVKV